MRKAVPWMLVLLAAATAVAIAVRRPRGVSEPAAVEGALRIAAFDAQIDAYRAVDPALILYEETAGFPVQGFATLSALAVDAQGKIHAGGGRLRAVFSPDGAERRRFELPADVSALAVDQAGRVFVGLGDTVHAYEADGARAAVFADLPPDAIVTSIATVSEHVFVADARSRTVLRFDPDGTLSGAIDGRGADPGDPGFVIPSPHFGLAPGTGRTLWVVNPGLHRLEEYNPDGIRIHAWAREAGLETENFSGCCNPCHIARLADGSLVTAERGIPRVKVYTRRGAFIGVVAAPDRFESPNPGLALAVDERDRVLVADADRLRVRIFERR